ncbi:ParA family protein [Citrobacter sp. Cpo150]|uniref:ParA family protein n=1 Tax=Citrobacter sp. Cpo150 TaxID=2985154 RepID=UPI0025759485|nr:ParA family protein [Citrobacter sp. Cpo150]MDM2765698.1 ParA family protein [Citrobacter sp. Cpo150]
MAKKPSTLTKSLLSQAVIKAIKSMCPVLCTGNGKGGVGKSTWAFHIAAAAAEAGLKPIIIDMDEHMTLAATGSTHPDLPDYAFSCDLFTEEGITKPIMELEMLPGCWFLPRDSRLDEVNSTPFESGIVLYPHSHMAALREEFDLVIIDTPPGKGNLQQAAFLCADTAAMITELSQVSINGLVTAITVTETLVEALDDSNYKLPTFIVIPNKYNSRSDNEKAQLADLKSYGVLLTNEVAVRTPIKFATDNLLPVWKIQNGNARLAGKEMKSAIKSILELAVKK